MDMTANFINSSLKDTLSRAHALFLQTDHPLSPEMSTLRSAFLSPSCIEEFGDDELYLLLLENLIHNRDRMSFPEETSLYRGYFTDCVQLKNLEQSLPGYREDSYLADSLSMLDILKTPYYTRYFQTLIAMKSTFRDTGIMNQTMKDFYSIMIKSPEDRLPLIPAIAEQGLFYRSLSVEDEQVIRQLLLSTLALFTNAESSLADLKSYLEKEKEYFQTSSRSDLWSLESLPELLAERTLYLEDYPSPGILCKEKTVIGAFHLVDECDFGGTGAFDGILNVDLGELEVVPGGGGNEGKGEVKAGDVVVASSDFDFHRAAAEFHGHLLFLDCALVGGGSANAWEKRGNLFVFVVFFRLNGAVCNLDGRIFAERDFQRLLQIHVDGILGRNSCRN